jgi:hypothetical protein
MTTTITPSIEALDLRPLVELREESCRLAALVESGDRSHVERACELLDAESVMLEDFYAALVSLRGGSASIDLEDAATTVVAAIGTGDLGHAVDVALGNA